MYYLKMFYTDIYQPDEQHGDQKRHATDCIWSKNLYRLDQIVEEPGSHILYYLQGGPNRAFVPEEFMHIPEDTQAPPNG